MQILSMALPLPTLAVVKHADNGIPKSKPSAGKQRSEEPLWGKLRKPQKENECN